MFIFLILLAVIFFSKETVDSKENKYFKALIIINALEYLIEIPLQFCVRIYAKRIWMRIID